MSSTNAVPETDRAIRPDESVADFASRFFADEPAPGDTPHEEPKTDPVPSGTAPAPSAPSAAPTGTPSPTPSASRKVRLKEDDVETDIDIDEHLADEAKLADLKKWLQTGRQHDKIVERRTKSASEQAHSDAAKWFMERAEASGFEFVMDPTANQWVVRQKGSSPQTNGQAAAQPRDDSGRFTNGQTTPNAATPSEADQLAKEIEGLEKKLEDGEAEAKDIARLNRLQRKYLEVRQCELVTRETSGIKQRVEQTEAQRLAEVQAQVRQTAEAVAKSVFDANPAVFGKYDPEERKQLLHSAAQSAQTMDQLRANLEAFAVREARRWGLTPNGAPTTPQAQKPAAPPPPPVHNGAPPTAGGAPAPAQKKSTLERGWEKEFFPDE